MSTLKKISLVVLIMSYILLGINHFRNPDGYLRIIPAYLPFHTALNYFAGFFEVLFGLMLILFKTRRLAAIGMMLMLIAFLPVHIEMVQDAPLQLGDFLIIPTIAWLRLLGQIPLIAWAWWYTKD